MKKINPILAIFSVCIIVGLVVAAVQTDFIGNIKKHHNTTEKHAINEGSAYNEIYKEHLDKYGSSIYLFYHYDTKSTGFGGPSYHLVNYGNKSTFSYSYGPDYIYCDFTAEKYDELKELLLSVDLRPYQVPADSNGKLLYPVEDVYISICDGQDTKFYGIALPSNLGRIEDFFTKLKDAAE